MKKESKKPLEAYLSSSILAIMVIVAFAEVISRYIFSSSIRWSLEFLTYSFIWFIFISMSYSAKERSHIRIETLNRIVPEKIRPYTNIIGLLLWIALSVLVSWLGISYSISMLSAKSVVLKVSLGVVYLGIPIGYILMTFRIIGELIDEVKKIYSNKTV